MARFTEEQYLRFERAIAQSMAQRTDNSDSFSDSESLPDPELHADNSDSVSDSESFPDAELPADTDSVSDSDNLPDLELAEIQVYFKSHPLTFNKLFYFQNMCSICRRSNAQVFLLCGHRYHDNCIMMWLSKNQSCPNCR